MNGHPTSMIHALTKTVSRSQSFVADALAWRGASAEYAVVGWLMIGGALWLTQDVLAGTSGASTALFGCWLLALMVAISAIDARFGIIPDSLVLWLTFGGLLELVLLDWQGIVVRIASCALAFCVAAGIRAAYRAIRGYEGLGFGDVKFVTAGVIWVGLEGVPVLMLIAVLSALASLAIVRARGETVSAVHPIAFGPHLALGLWLAWLIAPALS
jgi:leader peptidase (prepilin peptidase)/N-methyltransferase